MTEKLNNMQQYNNLLYSILFQTFIDVALFDPKTRLYHWNVINQTYKFLQQKYTWSIEQINTWIIQKYRDHTQVFLLIKGISLWKQHFHIVSGD